MVVEKLDMIPVEFIFRICLTGSGLTAYKDTGEVCGHKLPEGLQDGDELPYIFDTPTNKAEEGHDEHISAASVRGLYPSATHNMINIIQIATEYAKTRGIKLADTKFEGSADKIGDEILTPDSSRFWDLKEWLESRKPVNGRKAPTSLDKELVRIWGKSCGIHKLDPKNPDDVAAVHSMVVPDEIIKQTTQVYRYIFWRLTGMTIRQYLRNVMKVHAPEEPPKNVVIICGSDSDLSSIDIKFSDWYRANIIVHVMSCHRNPQELLDFIRNIENVDVIIGVGGKALALPGMIDAWAHYFKKEVRVAGVALGGPNSDDLLAAQLSIKQLPGQPVVINEITEKAYSGPSGLQELLKGIDDGELPPAKPRKEKPVQLNVGSR